MLPQLPVYDDLDDAISAYIADATAVEPVNVWLSPTVKFVVKIPTHKPPRVVVATMVKDPQSNQFFMRPMNWPFLMRHWKLPERLGLPFDEKTLRRLAIAGFVKAVWLAPSTLLIDVESLWEHMQSTSGEDGFLWWTADRRARYQEAVSMTRNGSDKRAHPRRKNEVTN
jgi:hypothetical protein